MTCEFQWNFKENAEKQKLKTKLPFLHTEFLGSQINAELEGRAHQALNSGKIKGVEGKKIKPKCFLSPALKIPCSKETSNSKHYCVQK